MVVAQHIGRLGNNLFQISAAIGYANKFGYRWAVDPSSGRGTPYSSIHKVFPNLPKAETMGRKYHEHFDNSTCPVHGTGLDYCHYDYHPFTNRGDNVTLFGFWQSWKYFEDAKEEVKKVFTLDHYPEYSDYTSIHVRRGDYVQYSGSFPPVTLDYVHKGVGILNPDKVLIFSDDIDWCVANLMNLPCGLIEFEQGWDDRGALSRMASCGNHIIANSSFSWWAAYLGFNPDKKVVSPSHKRGNWYGFDNGVKKDCVDLIPNEWTQVEFR